MSRPLKPRFIEKSPKVIKFSPRGSRGRPNYVILRLEEYEALRLVDLIGLGQDEASKSMRISRQTFGRILKKSRQVIADALINGKIIFIKNIRDN